MPIKNVMQNTTVLVHCENINPEIHFLKWLNSLWEHNIYTLFLINIKPSSKNLLLWCLGTSLKQFRHTLTRCMKKDMYGSEHSMMSLINIPQIGLRYTMRGHPWNAAASLNRTILYKTQPIENPSHCHIYNFKLSKLRRPPSTVFSRKNLIIRMH
jgi:hypothetical protein